MLIFLIFKENQEPSDFMLWSTKIAGLSGAHLQSYCEVFSFYSDDNRNVLNNITLRKLTKNMPCFFPPPPVVFVSATQKVYVEEIFEVA